MKLIVGSTPQSDWQQLQSFFERAGCTVADRQQLEEWGIAAVDGTNGAGAAPHATLNESLKNSAGAILENNRAPAVLPVADSRYLPAFALWPNEFPDTHLLLLYSRPEGVVAEAMEAGSDPLEVLNEWRKGAEHLMSVHRHNRRRSVLVNAQAMFTDTKPFIRICNDRFGLKINSPKPEYQDSPPVREIYKLIAAQLVYQTPGMEELLAEMEASSLLLTAPGDTSEIDCTEVYRDYRKLRNEAEGTLQDLEKENELLLLQLHQVQEELESHYLQLQEEVEERKKEREKAKKGIEQMEKKLADHQRKLRDKEKALSKARKRIEMIRTSTSWRLMGPLRVAGRLLKRPFKKAKAGQKNTGRLKG